MMYTALQSASARAINRIRSQSSVTTNTTCGNAGAFPKASIRQAMFTCPRDQPLISRNTSNTAEVSQKCVIGWSSPPETSTAKTPKRSKRCGSVRTTQPASKPPRRNHEAFAFPPPAAPPSCFLRWRIMCMYNLGAPIANAKTM